ncbi:MAG: DsbA family protein [Acidimicrobiales bacterium]
MNDHEATREEPRRVDFHFDPMCPFAYTTSVWIRTVRDELGVEVGWRFFSLEEVNRADGKKHPWERAWSYGWSLMRIGALLRRRDMAELDAWYSAVGAALHRDGEKPHDPEVARALLEQIGLNGDLLDKAIGDPTTHEDVMADHERVINAGGFGVPTLIFPDGQAIFGPVVKDPPSGADAIKLWRLVTGWLDFPHLYEIQRPKSRADLKAISESLQPYLAGRDWESIDRGRRIAIPDLSINPTDTSR